MKTLDLGLVSFSESEKVMNDLVQEIIHDEKHQGAILFFECLPTITLGLQGNLSYLLTNPLPQNVALVKTDRGGEVTAHEPGQLVMYPLIPLKRYKTLLPRSYVSLLEESVLEALTMLGLSAHKDSQHPGVYFDKKKICSIGIRVQEKITKHGLALNVSNNLTTFRHIIPCGLKGYSITSLIEQGVLTTIDEVKKLILKIFLNKIENFK